MSKRNAKSMLWVIFLLVLAGAAVAGYNWFTYRGESGTPQKQMNKPSPIIMSYFPMRAGTKWIYHGFAEYDHQMTLRTIRREPRRIVQRITGQVGDPSGGESKRNFNFRLEYVFAKNTVTERILMADTPFPHRIKNLKLLSLPLRKGTKWSQTVTMNGKPTVLTAEIIAVARDTRLKREKITVRYRMPMKGMPQGIYEEERDFVKGMGVTRFEKTFGPRPEERFNYALFRLMIPERR